MKRLTATTPVGLFSRRTSHDYQYVVVGINEDGRHYQFRWSKSLSAAKQGAREAMCYGHAVAGIYPVDGAMQATE